MISLICLLQKKEVDTWSDEVFLNKAKLTIEGRITNTAILLLGKPESLHYINHIGEIVWQLAGKDNVGQVFTIPFLLTTTEVMHKIRNYPFKIFPNNSFLPSGRLNVFLYVCFRQNTLTVLQTLSNYHPFLLVPRTSSESADQGVSV